MRYKSGRADVGIGPYESVTRGAVRRADVGIGPYESVTRGAVQILAGGIEPRPCGCIIDGAWGRATARVAPTEGCEECVGWVSALAEAF